MAPKKKCTTCQDLKKNPMGPSKTVVLKNVLEVSSNMSKKKRKVDKKNKEKRFLKYVNALLNEGGGLVCLHVENAQMLGTFEQSVNRVMANMIPDNTTFPETFERHVVGKDHVVFRVKPQKGMLSTYSFKTKISFDCGVEDPNHGQMRHLLKRKMDTVDKELYKDYEFTFRENDEVKMTMKKIDKSERVESVFQERKDIQAKRFIDKGKGFEATLKSDFFQEEEKPSTYLPKYISAFSKLPDGGFVFLGVKEDKTPTSKWTKVEREERDKILTLKNPQFSVWKAEEDQYFVTKDIQMDEVETGLFKTEGIGITDAEQATLSKSVKDLIRENMFLLPIQIEGQQDTKPSSTVTGSEQQGTALPDLVEVKLHDVKGAKDKFVVEIRVKKCEGMLFHNKAGPVAYQFSKYSDDGVYELKQVEANTWLKGMHRGKCICLCSTDTEMGSSAGSSQLADQKH